MIELSPKERAALRARAHPLHPVVSIGQHGLTEPVLHEIDIALTAHELVKVRVHAGEREVRAGMLALIAETLQAAPVQHLGKLLVLWRPRPAEAVPAPPARTARATKPAKRGVKQAAVAPRERKPSASPVPRSRTRVAPPPSGTRGTAATRRRRGFR